tara:strand:+ start:260 stop:1078 length:819 start_codon:yes stop_codon:yes gene_type:complete
MLALYKPLQQWFHSTSNRHPDSDLYAEYLSQIKILQNSEILKGIKVTERLRVDLQEAKDAVQKVVDAYEAKLSAIKDAHIAEIAELKEKHQEEVDALVVAHEIEISRLQEVINTQNIQIQELTDELELLKKELLDTKIKLRDALCKVAELTQKVDQLENDVATLTEKLVVLAKELAENKEELEDTKKELIETIDELRATDAALKDMTQKYIDRQNQLGMSVNDGILPDRLVTQTKRAKALDVQLTFANREIASLEERVGVMEMEIHDLTAGM